jgi:hypothetical protein
MFGDLGAAQREDGDLVLGEELEEERVSGTKDYIILSLLELIQMSVVNCNVGVVVSSVLEGVEQTDGSQN